ncbi:hypothetical protein [Kitasatospora sp. NPDC085879]|uniref:hypothetical protein n=1 Tax=Kitasatospora sp. NPDC085879 TaxID=3154769 RepID=UPI0034231B23
MVRNATDHRLVNPCAIVPMMQAVLVGAGKNGLLPRLVPGSRHDYRPGMLT